MVAHNKQKLTKQLDRGKMSHQRKTKLKGHLELVPPSRKRAEKVRSSAVLTITVTSRLSHSRTHLPCTTQASAKSTAKKRYNPNVRCDYHMHGAGHYTSDCYDLKHKIQDLIDQKLWNPSKDVISTPQRAFAPWYPIAPTSARLRSQLKNEEDFPEVAMITVGRQRPVKQKVPLVDENFSLFFHLFDITYENYCP